MCRVCVFLRERECLCVCASEPLCALVCVCVCAFEEYRVSCNNNFAFQLFDVNTPNDMFRKLPNSMRSLADRLLDGDSVLSRVSAGSLNRSHTPDMTLMAEMQMVDHVLSAVSHFISLNF